MINKRTGALANQGVSVKWRLVVPGFVLALLCYIGFMYFNPLYISTDNIGVAIIANGYYGTNNYCQFIHPLLCLLIRFLTPVLPTVDVFTLLIHIVIAIQIGTLFLLLTDVIFEKPLSRGSVSDIGKILTTGMTILLFTSGITVWNANYTITTGAIVLFGLIICFISERKKRGASWIIIGTFTLCFGCMLRMESALLFLPFIVLEALAWQLTAVSGWPSKEKCLHEGDESNQRKYRLLPTAVIIILLFLSRSAFYAREPYCTAGRYNVARTVCVDFPTKSWSEELETSAKGMFTKSDYLAATDWCFIDTDFLDADMLERIAAAGEKNKYEISVSGIKGILSEMRYTLFHSSLYMIILVTLSVVLAVRNVIVCSIWGKAETVLAILGAALILMYFTFRGRAPMRVWEPVIFATDFNLLMSALFHPFRAEYISDRAYGHLFAEVHEQSSARGHSQSSGSVQDHGSLRVFKQIDWIFGILIFIILWFSTGQLIANASFHEPQPVWMSRIPAEDSSYQVTVSGKAGEDALFIWPNWHGHIPQESTRTGRLPSKEVLRHNIALGDWVYGQPYYNAFLKSIDTENPAAALLNRPNTYLMTGQNSLVSKYLSEHAKGLAGDGPGGLADDKKEKMEKDRKDGISAGTTKQKDKTRNDSVLSDEQLPSDTRIIAIEVVPELGFIDGSHACKVRYETGTQ